MKVILRNPRREVEIDGARTVNRLLDELDLVRESHLVIRNGTLSCQVTANRRRGRGRVRPVISGVAREREERARHLAHWSPPCGSLASLVPADTDVVKLWSVDREADR